MQVTSSKKTIHYKVPDLRRERIGSKPSHYFDQNPKAENPYVPLPDEPANGGDRVVWANQPVRAQDGQVQFKEVSKTVDLTPRDPWTRGLTYGAMSAIPGALGGAFLGEAVNLASILGTNGSSAGIGALLGAAVVGGTVGYLTGAQVYGEKTELAWDTHQVYEHTMEGYHELVGLGRKNDEKGYFHRFMPEVKSEVVGEYKTPKVIRYKGEKPVEEGGLESNDWPDVIVKKEPDIPNRKVDVEVSYEKPNLRSKFMGRMPSDYWDYSSWSDGYRECGPDGCNTGGRSVYRSTPVYEPNNEPGVRAVDQRLTEEASHIAGTAISYGLGGAAFGGIVGMAAGAIAGLDPTLFVAGGAALGAVGGAVYGANTASDDRVRVEWRERNINEKKMTGYSESVRRRYVTRCRNEWDPIDEEYERKCRQEPEGWYHDFYARVNQWSVGTYVAPVIVHYSAKEEGETPKK